MKKNNLKTGQIGEQAAAKFLKEKGYKIIDQNFRTRFGEIDLIAKKNQVLVFVEVKARMGNLGKPEWQITARKINRVQKMAKVYLAKKQPDYDNLRIDAVCIVFDENMQIKRTKHYQNVRF